MKITLNFKHMKYEKPQKGRYIVVAANDSDDDEIGQIIGFGSEVWNGDAESQFRMERINSWWWAYYNPGNIEYIEEKEIEK